MSDYIFPIIIAIGILMGIGQAFNNASSHNTEGKYRPDVVQGFGN